MKNDEERENESSVEEDSENETSEDEFNSDSSLHEYIWYIRITSTCISYQTICKYYTIFKYFTPATVYILATFSTLLNDLRFDRGFTDNHSNPEVLVACFVFPNYPMVFSFLYQTATTQSVIKLGTGTRV